MRMVQTCAASMMYKAQAEGILGRPVPSTLCTPAVTQLTDAAACRLWRPGRCCSTCH